MKYTSTVILTLITCLLLVACNNTKYLAAGQSLYTGAKVHIQTTDSVSQKSQKQLRAELKNLIRPLPNSSLLGMHIKLWIYNIAGTPKSDKGLKHWIKYKLGEPPVLTAAAALEKNRAILQNRLENRGYFQDTVTVDTINNHQKVQAIYTAVIGRPYTIDSVSFPADSSVLSKDIQRIKKRSLLKKGNPYDLDVIKLERERIDTRLKETGYFYFNPDYLYVEADSTMGKRRVNMQVKVKRQTPAEAKNIFRINDVVVFADYDIDTDTSHHQRGITRYNGYTIIDSLQKFKPEIFSRTLVFKPGDVYNRTNHNLSLNRLSTLGVYKFVKARFVETDTVPGHALNAFYYLTPSEKKSLRFEVSGLTKSNNSTGGELSVSWRNRNTFRGAELLTASVYGGLEQQITGGQSNQRTTRFGADLNLLLPRIIGPVQFKTNSGFVPKTRINTGYELFDRTSQYVLNSVRASFGYVWKGDIRNEHQLNVLAVNLVRPSHITPEFQLQLDTNIALRRSIEKQFIIGPNYNYNYNSQAKLNHKRNNYYLNANIDLSANLMGILLGADIDKGKEYKIFNTPFSQYARFELDLRHYLRLGEFTSLVSRFNGGVGIAYGNSSSMPFVKEFFAGGTNDIRAFRARGLGPGSYKQGPVSGYLPDQPGDVKLEINTELRAKLFSIVRGALFIDAGNVWTLRDDPERPGAKITNHFLQDVAIGAGMGIRFDISIMVLRIDYAYPLRDPSQPPGSRWVINNPDISKSIVNLAIGYPF